MKVKKTYLQQVLEKEPDSLNSFELQNGNKVDFLLFFDRPFKGAVSIFTDGLKPSVNTSQNQIDFIFTFSVYSKKRNREILSLLCTYLDFHFHKKNHEITSGDFFQIKDFKLIEDFDYVGFYTLHAAYFPNYLENKYLWLLPIFKSEFDFLSKYGSAKFQTIIEEKDPDLTKLNRNPII